MNRRQTSVVANPVLIGAVTVLVTIVAVFFAYNANEGLPFVPTYQIRAQVHDAANLVDGNEVRIGGYRVGIISSIDPVVHRNGNVTASLALKLDTQVKPLPVDSTVIVRPRSSVGLKYLEITPGDSDEGFKEGSTMPLKAAKPIPVEIDEFFNMFDKRTRLANRANLKIFGTALAGRGADINVAIHELDPLTANLIPVMRNLTDPSTALGEFFGALQRTASAVAPVAAQQGQLFESLAITFDAFEEISRPYLQDAISGGPPAMQEAIDTFPFQRKFLANSTAMFNELAPGAQALRGAAPLLAEAFTVGARTVRRATALNKRLERMMRSVEAFASDPQVPLGIHGLRDTVQELTPTINNLASVQTQCNYIGLLLNNAARMLADHDTNNPPQGSWARLLAIAGPIGPNSEGGPASAPADAPNTYGSANTNHLHSNPYPLTGAPGQRGICMAANEQYVEGRVVIGNPPGTPRRTIDTPEKLFLGWQP